MLTKSLYSDSFIIGALVKRHGMTFRAIADRTGAHIQAVACFHLGARAASVVRTNLIELWEEREHEKTARQHRTERRRGGKRSKRNRERNWTFAETGART